MGEQSQEDRRKFRRAEFPCKIVVGSPIRLLTSHTENLSEGGIRVLLEERVAPFTMVGLEIYIEKEKPITCKGKIMWVQEKINPLENKATLYDTGIQFVRLENCEQEYFKKLVRTIMGEEKT